MANNIPITQGTGASSVAAETVSGISYQQVELYGAGGSSVLSIAPDGSARVSVIGTVTVTGSIIAVGNPSVSGTVGASIIGLAPVQIQGVGGTPGIAPMSADNIATGTIGLYTNSAGLVFNGGTWDRWRGNSSVGGLVNTGTSSVITTNVGSVITVSQSSSILAVPVGSVITVSQNSSILAVPVGSVITVFQSSSLIAINAGSVVTVSSGSVITVWKDSSVLSVPVGSTIALLQSPSIVGTYAEDAAHSSGDKGVFMLGVRNDTLSSITSTDSDYSPLAVDPTGAMTVHDSPITKWVQGTADLRGSSGGSIAIIAAQGASVFTYIREVQVANMGSASVLVTLGGGLGSILGYTIAPAGGGSNFITRLKTGENSAFTASISGISSVLVSAQGFISKT